MVQQESLETITRQEADKGLKRDVAARLMGAGFCALIGSVNTLIGFKEVSEQELFNPYVTIGVSMGALILTTLISYVGLHSAFSRMSHYLSNATEYMAQHHHRRLVE